MLLYLIRHAKTVMNEAWILNWQAEDLLNETWKEQAIKLGMKFKNTKIDTIWSSDLQRTKDTAQAIIDQHPTLKNNNQDIRLRERSMWEFEWVPSEDIRKIAAEQGMSRWKFSEHDSRIEHGEKVLERFYEWFNEHIKDSWHEAVAVITHGASIRLILAHIVGMTPRDYLDTHQGIENTWVSIISINDKWRRRVVTINDFSHLSTS